MCWIYVLRSHKDGRYYTGSTSDLKDRFKRHSEGRVKATKFRRPLELVYAEKYGTLTEARKREYQIKREKSSNYIDRLIKRRSCRKNIF